MAIFTLSEVLDGNRRVPEDDCGNPRGLDRAGGGLP
jgi:hypothetical protein